MASLDTLYFANQSAASQGLNIFTPNMETPVMWIRWLGTVSSGATVEVAATTGDITFTTDGSTVDTTIDSGLSDGGTSDPGVIDVSDTVANTFGKVAGLINASENWQCYLLGVLPEDGSGAWMIATTTAIDVSTAAMQTTGLYLFGDEGNSFDVAYAISGFDPSKSTTEHYDDDDCVSYLQWALCNLDSTSEGTFRVYSANQTSSTLLFKYIQTDDTTFTYGDLKVRASIVQSKIGERLVVMGRNDEDGQATDEFNCLGWTVDRSGQRYVNGYKLTNANA